MGAENYPSSSHGMTWTLQSLPGSTSGREPTITDAAAAQQQRERREKAKASRKARKLARRRAR